MATALDAYGPFDAGPGANFFEDRWRKMMRHMLGSASGVIRGAGDNFEVFADSSGLQVKVKTGECWMHGHWGESTVQRTLPVAAAAPASPRKDLVVLRADFLGNVVELDVLTGTPAASPVVPAVAQNTAVWETALAVVDVPAGAVTVAAGNVTDQRVYTTITGRYRQINASTSVANDVSTKLPFNTIVVATGDVVPNAAFTDFTVQRSGIWAMTARASFNTNSTGWRQCLIARSGDGGWVYAVQSQAAIATASYITVSTTTYLAAGESLSVYGRQTSGAALGTLSTTFAGSQFDLTWVGP